VGSPHAASLVSTSITRPSTSRSEKKKRQLPVEAIDAILKAGYTGPEDFGGPDGFLHQLVSAVVNRALNTELDHHLGYDKGEVPPDEQANRRNGHSLKTMRADQGPSRRWSPETARVHSSPS
jgi:putative transposase